MRMQLSKVQQISASVTTHASVHYKCAGTSMRWFKMRTTSTLSRVWHLKNITCEPTKYLR